MQLTAVSAAVNLLYCCCPSCCCCPCCRPSCCPCCPLLPLPCCWGCYTMPRRFGTLGEAPGYNVVKHVAVACLHRCLLHGCSSIIARSACCSNCMPLRLLQLLHGIYTDGMHDADTAATAGPVSRSANQSVLPHAGDLSASVWMRDWHNYKHFDVIINIECMPCHELRDGCHGPCDGCHARTQNYVFFGHTAIVWGNKNYFFGL